MTGPPPSGREARGPSLLVTLLLSMLAVVALAVGGMFLFSNLAVRREIARLPPEVQTYLRARAEAERRGEAPPHFPAPPHPESAGRVAGEGASTVGAATAAQSGAAAGGARSRRSPWPAVLNPRTQDFVRGVQRNMLQGGLLAAGLGALLSVWLSRRIALPLGAVARAATGLASGDLGARAPDLRGDREVADLARTFNHMATSLQALERERQQAVADIAHELRTPIAVMQARLDALEDGVYPLNTEQIELLSGQTQLLTRLVGDLRTLTLADAGRLGLQRQPLDLASLTRQVVRDLGDRAASRGLDLTLSAGPAPVLGDPDRLRQVILNLLDNALVHARRDIQVTVAAQDGGAQLTVDDDGPGIAPESRQVIFTRFARLDESRSRHTGGSGLGLAIVQALAGAHGGRCEVAQSPQGGARFSLTLPLGH
ncbi:sensor histidine kinase [Deinococcus hohokamensis]|uniref:histidine kinase n=1 Tax=Deinococcus hohokamensis TaxID=309883 RepID=A0ABV9IBA3_9DEIO